MSTHEPRTRSRPQRTIARRGTLYGQSAGPRTGAQPPAPPPSRRADIISLSGLNVLAGIWLIIAPWVLSYSAKDPTWNDVVFGIIVGVLALIRVTGAYWEQWVSAINALIGVWLFIAAFTIDASTVASWNDIILGIVVFLLAVGSATAANDLFAGPRRTPTSL